MVIIKERNPEYVFRFWQEGELWYGSLLCYGKWLFDDIGYERRREIERELSFMSLNWRSERVDSKKWERLLNAFL